mmetsp:Transcript_15829/g.30975  ORF Transcript_15829/g.30975 Transcript_15829/m.30975 type:complete len:611 (-) Transcript_15829:62-1894(-)
MLTSRVGRRVSKFVARPPLRSRGFATTKPKNEGNTKPASPDPNVKQEPPRYGVKIGAALLGVAGAYMVYEFTSNPSSTVVHRSPPPPSPVVVRKLVQPVVEPDSPVEIKAVEEIKTIEVHEEAGMAKPVSDKPVAVEEEAPVVSNPEKIAAVAEMEQSGEHREQSGVDEVPIVAIHSLPHDNSLSTQELLTESAEKLEKDVLRQTESTTGEPKEEEVHIHQDAIQELAAEAELVTNQGVIQEMAAEDEPVVLQPEPTDYTDHFLAAARALDAKHSDVIAKIQWNAEHKAEAVKQEVRQYIDNVIKLGRSVEQVRAECKALIEAKMQEFIAEVLTAQASELQASYKDELQAGIATALDSQADQWRAVVEERVEVYRKQAEASVIHEFRQREQELLQAFEQDRAERLAELQEFKIQVEAFDSLLALKNEKEVVSQRLHRLSSAVSAITDDLEGNRGFLSAWNTLKHDGQGDPILEAALEAVSLKTAARGVIPMRVVQSRFRRVERACRQVAYLPKEDPTLFGFAVAKLFQVVTLREHRFLVAGTDDHARIGRASYYMEQGNLLACLQELEQTSPAVMEVCVDFVRDVKERLVVEQTLAVIKTHMSSLQLDHL